MSGRKRPVFRSAVLNGFAELCRELSADPVALVRTVGLNPAALVDPDIEIPAGPTLRLLEIAAAVSGALDFGVRLARWRPLSYLGALGVLVRDEPNIRAAVGRMISDMQLHSTCVALDIQERGDVAVIAVSVDFDGEPSARQATEAAAGTLVQLLRGLLGEDWSPDFVQFVHAPAAGGLSHRQFFGCPIEFATDRNAVVLPRTVLDRAVPLSDPRFRSYGGIGRGAAAPIGGRASEERIRQAMLRLLPQGRCTAARVASSLGVDRRTVNRRLGEAGGSFSKLRHAVRFELAQQYLAGETLALTDIAQLLGFHSLSAFSRWFSRRAGCAPTRWRTSAARAA